MHPHDQSVLAKAEREASSYSHREFVVVRDLLFLFVSLTSFLVFSSLGCTDRESPKKQILPRGRSVSAAGGPGLALSGLASRQVAKNPLRLSAPNALPVKGQTFQNPLPVDTRRVRLDRLSATKGFFRALWIDFNISLLVAPPGGLPHPGSACRLRFWLKASTDTGLCLVLA